jgi:hypothetical protein
MSNAFRKSCLFVVVIVAPLVSGCVRGEAIEMAQATANPARLYGFPDGDLPPRIK